jgi:hypothetical protein
MESAALFLLGKLRKVETGTLVVASNYIGDPAILAPDVLKTGIDHMIRVALKAALSLEEKR